MRYVMALAMVCGCSATGSNPDRGEMESTLRGGAFPSPANYLGNGDISVYEGHSTASEDCLIYTTIGTDVHAGTASDPVVMRIEGNSIVDPASGEPVCTRDGNALVDRVRSGGIDGPVLFTVMGRWVFDGEINTDQPLHKLLDDLEAQLLYTFAGPHIWEGSPGDGYVLATATAPVAHATPMRKLVLSSLIAGECGGLGVYADEDEEEHEYD